MISLKRREFLEAVAAASTLAICPRAFAQTRAQIGKSASIQFAELEKTASVRLGIFALDTANGAQVTHRADERFPLLSTFKVMAAAAILKHSESEPSFLKKRIRYSKINLVSYSPVTEKHLADGMTVAHLCAAALQYSDNTAANLLMRLLGGPTAVTAFAHSVGNDKFRLDRWETRLNTAIPGDARDTATPEAMARSLRAFTLGNALAPASRAQLIAWLRGNTTGDKRIRAAVPENWQVGDKTGSGDYGTANDIAVLWPPARAPIVMAIYTTQKQADAKRNETVIAEAARIALHALSAAKR